MQMKHFPLFITLCFFNGLLLTLSAPSGGMNSPKARQASPVRHNSIPEFGQQSAQQHKPAGLEKEFHKSLAANAKGDAEVWGAYAKGVAKTSAKGLLHGEFKDAAAGGALACIAGAACGARKVSQIYHNVQSKLP